MEQLLYLSTAREGLTSEEIAAILAKAQAHNTRDGLSGALLKYAGHFIQALEGPPESVQRCFERICADSRHHDLKVLRRTSISQRRFGRWGMRDVALQPGSGDRAVERFLDDIVDRGDAAQVEHLLAVLDQLAQRD
jgi:hypothetical protein